MTPQQVRAYQFVLFAKAAESMGKRIDELKKDTADHTEAIEAIRSEWLVED